MRLGTVAAFACALSHATVTFAQKEPSDVTDKEIARYQALAKDGCVQAGLSRGDPQDRVEAFCGCMLDTLLKSMSRSEWQQAYFYSLKEQSDDERRVVTPHLSKLDACRSK